MEMLLGLWLPIILSAGAVFVASAAAWMALPHHKSEWTRLPDEAGGLKALRGLNLAPGQFLFPHAANAQERKSEAFQRSSEEGPWGTLTIWGAKPNMGANMLWTFVFYVFASFLIAYLGSFGLQPGESFLKVFRFVGTAGVLTYCCAGVPNAIWFKRKMINDLLDGVVFGLLTGVIFAALWPSA